MTTTPAPAEQDLFLISTDFENVGFMLSALAESACLALEADLLPDHFSAGLHDLFRVALGRLDQAITQLNQAWADEKASIKEGPRLTHPNTFVRTRISCIGINALRDAGHDINPQDVTTWDDPILLEHLSRVDRYYDDLLGKLEEEGRNDLLTIGSYLPWLEMRIRRELGVATVDLETQPISDDNGQSLRDRLIAEQADAGVSISQISQAFGLKRAAVERIIGRLTAAEEDSRKAV